MNITPLKMNIIFQTSIFGLHFSFAEGKQFYTHQNLCSTRFAKSFGPGWRSYTGARDLA